MSLVINGGFDTDALFWSGKKTKYDKSEIDNIPDHLIKEMVTDI